jgi:hypothetical protein
MLLRCDASASSLVINGMKDKRPEISCRVAVACWETRIKGMQIFLDVQIH